MDETPIPSMPSEPDLPAKEMTNPSTNGSSLIQTHTVKPKRSAPMILWFLVLVSLLGTAGVGYMLYAQQNTLSSYNNALTSYQTNITQWSSQINTLQTTVASIQSQISLLTATPQVPTFSAMPTTLSTPTASSLSSTFPMGDDSIEVEGGDKIDDIRVTSTPQTEPSMFADDSLSGGRLSPEDEIGMINSYLREIVAGQHKTGQPDGISTFRSRETSDDGQVTYDIFKSSTDEDVFYIYVRKGPAADLSGWYGPFSTFPGA